MTRRIARMVIIVCVAGGLVFGAVNRSISLTGDHAGANGGHRNTTVKAPSGGRDQTWGTQERQGRGFGGSRDVAKGGPRGSSR